MFILWELFLLSTETHVLLLTNVAVPLVMVQQGLFFFWSILLLARWVEKTYDV